MRTVKEQLSFLKGEEPKKRSKIKDKPIDMGKVARNEGLLRQIDDILYNYRFPENYCPRCNLIMKQRSEKCDDLCPVNPKRMNINSILSLEHDDRVVCLGRLSKEDKEKYNYLIMGLFR